ncbi:MAG: two-component sensor histidine kinase [Crocinitomicaceae bacterium]|nr:two-component sensor histidine kinase [Crocinitomicaceae bacterium]
MRNLKPIYIILGGSLITLFITLIIFSQLNSLSRIPFQYILGASIIISLSVLIIFYFLIKYFITNKLDILYRSIRTGKFNDDSKKKYSLKEDLISNAELDTKSWREEELKTISKLKEVEAFRKEFLGNISHELKTPVFSIQGYILTLLEGGLEDKSVNKVFLQRASKAVERMTDILEDLDQIIEMEVKEIKLDIIKFNIVELVSDLFEDLKVQSKNRNIKLEFSKKYNPIWVKADKNKIAQVITNLLNNSISYGNENGITTVRFFSMDNIVTIEVSDNGPGISEEEIPRLFERFYRVEKSRDRHKGGTGLGLSIAKHIIESHGQTINVRSTVGVGSTFTFSLNREKN